jgi:hypothetical protein
MVKLDADWGLQSNCALSSNMSTFANPATAQPNVWETRRSKLGRSVPQAPVVFCAQKHMVPTGMHRHGRHNATARLKLLHKRLLSQIVYVDIILVGDKEPWLGGMEARARSPTVLAERLLADLLRQLMHNHARCCACWSGSGKVITPAMLTLWLTVQPKADAHLILLSTVAHIEVQKVCPEAAQCTTTRSRHATTFAMSSE